MRDVESLCQQTGMGKLSKSTASRMCEELKDRFEACRRGDLYEIRLVAAVPRRDAHRRHRSAVPPRTRPDRRTTPGRPIRPGAVGPGSSRGYRTSASTTGSNCTPPNTGSSCCTSEPRPTRPNDIVAWLPEQRILFAGDLAFNGGTPFALSGSISGWLDILEKLDALHPDSERIVGNLERAFAELRGLQRGSPIDHPATFAEMVTSNGGKPLRCLA
jgi:hypothetical protein